MNEHTLYFFESESGSDTTKYKVGVFMYFTPSYAVEINYSSYTIKNFMGNYSYIGMRYNYAPNFSIPNFP